MSITRQSHCKTRQYHTDSDSPSTKNSPISPITTPIQIQIHLFPPKIIIRLRYHHPGPHGHIRRTSRYEPTESVTD